jgi:hypothetical protein
VVFLECQVRLVHLERQEPLEAEESLETKAKREDLVALESAVLLARQDLLVLLDSELVHRGLKVLQVLLETLDQVEFLVNLEKMVPRDHKEGMD